MRTHVSPPPSLPLSNQPKTLVVVEGIRDQYSYEQNGTRLRGSIPSFSDEDFLCRGVLLTVLTHSLPAI